MKVLETETKFEGVYEEQLSEQYETSQQFEIQRQTKKKKNLISRGKSHNIPVNKDMFYKPEEQEPEDL